MATARSKAAGYGLPLGWIVLLLALYARLPAWPRFLGATLGLFLAVKAGAWMLVTARSAEYSLSPLETLLFWTVWPGVRPDLFAPEGESRPPEGRDFVTGYAFVIAGVLLGAGTVLAYPIVGAGVGSWLLIAAVLLVVHLGIGTLLPFFLRWLGVSAPALFDAPYRSRGIGDFWSQRWNYPFINMNRLFVTRPLAPRLGVAPAALVAFLASGGLHELAISYAAGAGWGTPFLYFVIQGILYTAEQELVPDEEGWRRLRTAWTYAAVLLPVPLLFHGPFRRAFVVPVLELARSAVLSHPLQSYVEAGLWIGAAGHFLVLAASFQVPERLEWETDLQSLKPLNRKLLWTYGGFIVLTIVSFGVLTAAFHGAFVAGTPVALGLAGMIAVFWTARLLVDFFYFSHDDWPEGVAFVVGHAMLTSLFVLLVIIYGGTIVFHLL